MGKKNLVSVTDFSCDEILHIMELAARFEADPHQQVLAGKVIASLFFEPSTRTRLSFESAINHLVTMVQQVNPDETGPSQSADDARNPIVVAVAQGSAAMPMVAKAAYEAYY